jgi:hypothetical protein
MSYEVWGDDDDGLDGLREKIAEELIGDGWLDEAAAAALLARAEAAESALAAERERAEANARDARRYRWLREGSIPLLCIRKDRHAGLHNVRMMGPEADAAVDAAMGQEPPQ